MFSVRPSVRPSVRSSVYQTHEHDMLKSNESNLLQIGTSGFGGQGVKGQGHATPKLHLEPWRRHHSRPL